MRWPARSARTIRLCALGILAAASYPQQPEAVFQAEVRLVEVYATVTDGRGKFVDGLAGHRFKVLEDGIPQPLVAFENTVSELSCVILLDATASMSASFPLVKNASLSFTDGFRPSDWVAVYAFSNTLRELQGFTRDKDAAQQALLRARAYGNTALFDSLAELARSISRRPGKKAIVLLGDGDDNSSVLNLSSSAERAKRAGVPVYAIAQGGALQHPRLLRSLEMISSITGGRHYRAARSQDLEAAFQDIAASLQHTYYVAYQAPQSANNAWRRIQLQVDWPGKVRVRAREGYFPK